VKRVWCALVSYKHVMAPVATFMQMGVTHMWGGVASELSPHHEWIRSAELFAILKKLVFFKKQRLFLVSCARCLTSFEVVWCKARQEESSK